MSENTIDKAYDTLINSTPDTAAEAINEAKDAIDNAPTNVVNYPTETTPPSNVESKKVMGVYDPKTGNIIPTEDEVDEETQQKVIEALSNVFVDPAEKAIGDLDADIKKFLNSKFKSSSSDTDKIAKLVAHRILNDSVDYYSEMPTIMQQSVNKIMLDANTENVPKNMIKHRNQVAKMIIDELVEEYNASTSKAVDLDTVLASYDKEIDNINKEMGTEIGNMMLGFDIERKKQIDIAIEASKKTGNTANVEKLETIKANIDKAFDLTDFKEYCKHCRIKPIEIKKPSRVFDNFNFKYEHNDIVINDIRACPDIIIRHMNEYTRDQAMSVCLAFCKYCANMNANDIADHTFMYYFIRNIIVIDRINPRGKGYATITGKDKEFYDTFVANIRECINNLLERNVTLK